MSDSSDDMEAGAALFEAWLEEHMEHCDGCEECEFLDEEEQEG